MNYYGYMYRRGLQLEGRFPYDVGVWPITACRLHAGEGVPPINDPRFDGSDHDPTDTDILVEPPVFAENELSNLFTIAYRRLRTADEVAMHLDKEAAVTSDYLESLAPNSVAQITAMELPLSSMGVSLSLSDAWIDPPKGEVPIPSSSERLLPMTHMIKLMQRIPGTHRFRFKNSWGSSWGDDNYGTLPFEYFESRVYDSWANYARPQVIQGLKVVHQEEVLHTRATFEVDNGVRLHSFDVFGKEGFKQRYAWAFVVDKPDGLHLEELYVRPEFRRRGFASKLIGQITGLIEAKKKPIHVWISYADCLAESPNTYSALLATLRKLPVAYYPCPAHQDAYFASSMNMEGASAFPIEPPSIPLRPRGPIEEVKKLARTLTTATVLAGQIVGPITLSTSVQNAFYYKWDRLVQGIRTSWFAEVPKIGTPTWHSMNKCRFELNKKVVAGSINSNEQEELRRLDELTTAIVKRQFPRGQGRFAISRAPSESNSE